MIQEGTDLLIQDEDLRLQSYRCISGKLSWGVGRNLEDHPLSPEEVAHVLDLFGQVNTTAAIDLALWFLRRDVLAIEEGLSQNLAFYKSLDPVRQSVLVNMAYNLGLAGLLSFHKTLAFISENKFEKAAIAMKESIWKTQVGQRAERLSEIMKNGAF